ncbi:MAG: RNA methyltransferase, partial [Clostridia bacterium]|nr:RNA methyltransferase [Clostridia bacterium]
RLGLNNCIVTSNSPKELADNFNEYFDYILVDAPCSGEGMFRKDPLTICEWQENTPEMNSLRQKEILFYADKMLKNGGKLIYSTCTYSQKEDEDIVEMMLGNGYQLLKPNEDVLNNSRRGITDNTHFACRFYPFDNIGEGQFVCLLQKENDAKSNMEVSDFAENNVKLDTKQGKKAKKLQNLKIET